jgi:acid phosphatase (class A)
MNKYFICGALVVAALCAPVAGTAQSVKKQQKKTPYFFDPYSLNYGSVLQSPPSDGSEIGRNDHETVVRLQKERTEAEIDAAQRDDQEEDIFIFRDVVGEQFTAENLPLTRQFSAQLKNDSEVVDPPLKHLFNRPRPYAVDKKLHPVCKLSTEPSYPSGHAMLGYLFGYVLAQMVPEKRDAILARADLYAHHRLICGVHYPQDLEASRIASAVLFGLISTNPEYRKELEAARHEIEQKLK